MHKEGLSTQSCSDVAESKDLSNTKMRSDREMPAAVDTPAAVVVCHSCSTSCSQRLTPTCSRFCRDRVSLNQSLAPALLLGCNRHSSTPVLCSIRVGGIEC